MFLQKKIYNEIPSYDIKENKFRRQVYGVFYKNDPILIKINFLLITLFRIVI